MVLRQLINETIKDFLNENITSIVYHFCSFDNLMNIIRDDAFRLMPQQIEKKNSNLRNNNNYFMCVTRQRHGALGYSYSYPIRIMLDGNLLMNNYHGRPFNYYDNKNKIKYHNDKGEIDRNQIDVENEDRIYSNRPIISNIRKYIKQVDINLTNPMTNDYLSLKQIINFLGIDKVVLYMDDMSYELGNGKNTIDFNSLEDYDSEDSLFNEDEFDIKIAIDSLVSIIFYAYKTTYKSNLKFRDFCDKIINDFNLEKYKNYIHYSINKGLYTRDFVENRLNVNLRTLRRISNIDEFKKIAQVVGILLKNKKKV